MIKVDESLIHEVHIEGVDIYNNVFYSSKQLSDYFTYFVFMYTDGVWEEDYRQVFDEVTEKNQFPIILSEVFANNGDSLHVLYVNEFTTKDEIMNFLENRGE